MKHPHRLAALLLTTALACAAQAAPIIQGSFHGQIQSSGRYVPVTTTFTTDKDGQISGRYLYREDKNNYPGALNNCEDNDSVNVRCN